MRIWITASLLSAIVAAAAATALAADKPGGYLSAGEFDVTQVLEPAPRAGDPRYETDRKIFRATRALIGSDRWALATRDVELNTPALLRDFSCAVGTDLTPENAPRLVRLLVRAGTDTAAQSGHAKDVYKRGRPFTIDRGQICQPQSELFDKQANRMSYDYPSGHTTRGWTYALVLTAAAPDRAQAILQRGRAYGDSRFICGAHNESAVEAGFLSASATMALVSTKPDYQADLAAARAELDAVRASGSKPQGCEAEGALIAQRVMPRLDRAH
ncbi:phosphatase PAP2 family protein [Sphingomonas sp. KR3-1]|uniref:acid phosphatase n=1 Tax=Sphingomonas sp. KR3-1 TaxID=3156611 RepID=UPI0032B5643F